LCFYWSCSTRTFRTENWHTRIVHANFGFSALFCF